MQAISAEERQYYRILQVLPSADINIIERTYWHLAYRYHNAISNDPSAGIRLDRLNEAMSAIGRLQCPGSETEPRHPPFAGFTSALRDMAFDTWWFMMVVASMTLGVALVDHWAGLGGLSEHLAAWRRMMIVGSSVTLAGLMTVAMLTWLPALVRRLRLTGDPSRIRADNDYYAVLHLERFAEPEIVKIAYQHLSHKFVSRSDWNRWAAQALAEVEEAFGVIGNPERRATYDSLMAPAPAPASPVAQVPVLSHSSANEGTPDATLALPILTTAEPLFHETRAAELDSASNDGLNAPSRRERLSEAVARWLSRAAAAKTATAKAFVATIAQSYAVITFARMRLVRLLAILAPLIRRSLSEALRFARMRLMRLLAILAPLVRRSLSEALRATSSLIRNSQIVAQLRLLGRSTQRTEMENNFASARVLERLSLRDRSGKDLAEEKEPSPPPVATDSSDIDAPRARLAVIAGETTVRTVTLVPDTHVTIGSDSSCDLVLLDNGGQIAPRQVRIWARQEKFMFHSLSSDLSATVQGKPFVWVVLDDGDVIELGKYRIRFELVSQAQGEPAASRRGSLEE